MLLLLFYFSAAGIREKCHLISFELQPVVWAINQWKRDVFLQSLGTGSPAPGLVMLFRLWRRCRVFPPLGLVSFFCALGAVAMFSRAWRCCHVLPRLSTGGPSSLGTVNMILHNSVIIRVCCVRRSGTQA